MSSVSKAFGGVIENTAPYLPGIGSDTLPQEGHPTFEHSETLEPIGFEPWNWKNIGRINAKVMGVIGNIGNGKTSTMQQIAWQLGQRPMNGRPVRTTVYNMRRRAGVSESAIFTAFNGCEEVDLSRYRLNPYSCGLKMPTHWQLSWTEQALKYMNEGSLTLQHKEALRHGLKKMRRLYPETADPDVLIMCLRTLDDEDRLHHLRARHAEVVANRHGDEATFVHMREALESKENPIGKTSGLFDAAQEIASLLEELQEGPYGEVFGGEHDLSEVLGRKVVAWDFSLVSDAAIPLIQSMLWDINTFGIATFNHGLFTDIELHDEDPSRWRDLTHARRMHNRIKWIRSSDSLLIMAAHRLADYRTVAGVGSEQYALATNMLDDIDIWLMGGMSRSAALEMQERHDLSDIERDLLVRLARPELVGHWLLKVGQARPIPVHTNLTDIASYFTKSDAANDQAAIIVPSE